MKKWANCDLPDCSAYGWLTRKQLRKLFEKRADKGFFIILNARTIAPGNSSCYNSKNQWGKFHCHKWADEALKQTEWQRRTKGAAAEMRLIGSLSRIQGGNPAVSLWENWNERMCFRWTICPTPRLSQGTCHLRFGWNCQGSECSSDIMLSDSESEIRNKSEG